MTASKDKFDAEVDFTAKQDAMEKRAMQCMEDVSTIMGLEITQVAKEHDQ